MKNKLYLNLALLPLILSSCSGGKNIKPAFVNLANSYYTFNPSLRTYVDSDDTNVSIFNNIRDATYDINIKFKTDGIENVESIKFYYSLNKDFSDSKCVEVRKNAKVISINNLLKASKYYIKLVVSDGNKEYTETSTLNTSDLGPRVLSVGGIDNVRDLGGYKTFNGKEVKQNLFFRGSELNLVGDHGLELTEEGDDYLSNELKIKTELDLRRIGLTENGNITESPISSASYVQYQVGGGYDLFFNQSVKPTIKQIFTFLSNEENYPVYVHCWGGADRTGTLCFLFNALLGVSKTDLIHDYEFTTFSRFGERNHTWNTPYNFRGFLTAFEALNGNNYQEKAKTYLTSIGITEEQMNNIINLMVK